MRRRRFVGDERQLEVIDDSCDHGLVGEESDDLHRAPALRSDQRVNLIDLRDHLGPAIGGERLEPGNGDRDGNSPCRQRSEK